MESSEEQETVDQEETFNDENGDGDAQDGTGQDGKNSAELVESSSEIGGSDLEDLADFDSAFVHLSENTNAATHPSQQNFKSSDPFDEDDVSVSLFSQISLHYTRRRIVSSLQGFQLNIIYSLKSTYYVNLH